MATASVPVASVTVSAQVVGRTPSHIGYNMGENFPGSNVSSWLRYSEMNGARVWWPQDSWPELPARWRTGANDLARFEAERTRVRADPIGTFDWKGYEANLARLYGGTPDGTIGHSFSVSELRKMGADVLIMMSRTTSRQPFDTAAGTPDWFGRWTYWRGVYLNAFYLARHYNVERFQLFNEPDHVLHKDIEQADFIRRLQIGSDAVQAALMDVNRIYRQSLRPRISAPVTAGMMVFQRRNGRPDTRDAQTGWGELAMRHRKDDFAGRGKTNQEVFQVYAFQNYTRNPDSISGRLPGLMMLIAQANGGVSLPVIISEMNVSTAGDFAKTKDTLDTPRYYAAFGAIAAAYSNAGIDEIYVFRLTQATWERGGVKKNGTHIIDNGDPLKTILRSTKGAEAVRLFMRGFKGGRVRFAPPTSNEKDIHTLAARDEKDGSHSLMLSNLGEARTLALDLSAWKLPTNALTVVEEVSETHHGDVSRVLPLPAGGKWTLSMSAHSIALVTVRPKLLATPSITPLTIAQSTLSLTTSLPISGRAFLSLRASATTAPSRVRIYGGAGNTTQAELLGQVTLETRPTEVQVDVTRYIAAANGQPLVFQCVPEQATGDQAALRIDAAALRIFH